MMSKKFETLMIFKTASFENFINKAMLTRFPQAEWNKVRSRSVFQSASLLKAIVEHYFKNPEQLLPTIENAMFDVFNENELHLTFESSVQPIFDSTINEDLFSVDFQSDTIYEN